MSNDYTANDEWSNHYAAGNYSVDAEDSSSAALQREIRSTRERMNHNLQAIEERLAPSEILGDVVRRVTKGSGSSSPAMSDNELIHSVGRLVRDNPIPAALIGLGIAGVLTERTPSSSELADKARRAKRRASDRVQSLRQTSAEDDDSGSDSSRLGALGERAKEHASSLGDRASSLGDSASHALAQGSEALSRGGGRVRRAKAQVRASVGQAYDRSMDLGSRAKERVADDPVLLGAIGVAIGAALGASMPRTQLEDETLGPVRDKLMGQAKEVASTVKQSATKVASTLRDESKTTFRQVDGQVRSELPGVIDNESSLPAGPNAHGGQAMSPSQGELSSGEQSSHADYESAHSMGEYSQSVSAQPRTMSDVPSTSQPASKASRQEHNLDAVESDLSPRLIAQRPGESAQTQTGGAPVQTISAPGRRRYPSGTRPPEVDSEADNLVRTQPSEPGTTSVADPADPGLT